MSLQLSGLRIGLLTSSPSRLGGGVFEAVSAQARIIRHLGGEAMIFGIADQYVQADKGRYAPSTAVTSPRHGPRQIGFAPSLFSSLLEARLDCLHLHGIWMYPSRAATLWARSTRRPYIISPHGMLEPWIVSRGRWKKALARLGYERGSWRTATVFHALTHREAQDIARETGRSDSVVIANAGPETGPVRRRMPPPVVAYVGRIHRKKNLAALIAGWNQARLPEGARLVLAGWGDDADVDDLHQRVAVSIPGVEFVGPLFGTEKQSLLDSARFVILPSLSEGLPMAVLEAWAAGTPTIMTGECNLPDGFVAGAAIESGYDAQSIAAVLERAMKLPEQEWLAMSAAAMKLSATNHSPDRIASDWERAYLTALSTSAAAR